MNYYKMMYEFINEVMEDAKYANADDIRSIIDEMIGVLTANKDASLEEIIEKVIENDIDVMEEMRSKYLLPGYTIGVRVGNINLKYFGGTMDDLGMKMDKDAMFDIASMTKMYTQVVLFNLIKEGKISLDDKIGDLDKRFVNIGDVSIRELSEFSVDFFTPGNMTTMEKEADAKEALFNATVATYPDGNVKRGKYFYNDFVMMILKEVMENVTGENYEDLVDKYIVDKLGLKNTKLIVPKEQEVLLTGSPNTELGGVNDPKAISVGGFSGHAGVFASSDDLIEFGKGMVDGRVFPESKLALAYTSGLKNNRGVIGNTYIATSDGLESSYIDTLSDSKDFAIQGSTRTQMNIGENSVSTILLNPASANVDKAKEYEEELNAKREKDGKAPVSIVKNFMFEKDGSLKEYYLVDARQILPYTQVDPLSTMNAKTSLRLRFLNKLMDEYDKQVNVEIDVNEVENSGKRRL